MRLERPRFQLGMELHADEPGMILVLDDLRQDAVRRHAGEAHAALLDPESRVAAIYGMTEISERHRHRYEVNIDYKERLEEQGLIFSGMSPDGVLPEIVEIADHPWFIGVQFHPELKSKPLDPHPLFGSFIGAAMQQSRLV